MKNHYFNEDMKNQLAIVARQDTKVGKTEELIHLIEGLVEDTRKENGNLCYNVFQDIDNPTKILFYEMWKDEAAFNAHCESEHVKNYRNKIQDLVEGELVLDIYERSIAPIPTSSKNGLVLFAQIKAIEGKAAELQTILEDLIPLTLAEKGAEHYELHKQKGEANHFMFHETWTTVADWDAHMLTKHLIDFLEIISNYVVGGINVSKTKLIF